MMRTVRRILVAVKDPKSKALPAVVKAVQLARASGAELELFHGIATPIYLDALGYIGGGARDIERSGQARALRELDIMAARVRKRGVKVTTAVEWDFPVYEAIIRRANRIKADLIVMDCHAGAHFAPWLLRLTDWEVLRHSPIPVLLVKNRRPYRHPVVLAAVDPTHAFAKPNKLDNQILSAAARLRTVLRGTLHAVHAYSPLPAAVASGEAADADAVARMVKHTEDEARVGFDRLLRATKISRVRRHLVGRHPIDAIQDVVREIGSHIVIMGAISRSGLKRVFIGNTAERLLDALACDVLIVKPRRFPSHVERAKRGVRLVVAQPLPLPM